MTVRPVRETKTQVTLKRSDYEALLLAQAERDDYLQATKLMQALQGRKQAELQTATTRGWLEAMRDWSHTLVGVMAQRG